MQRLLTTIIYREKLPEKYIEKIRENRGFAFWMFDNSNFTDFTYSESIKNVAYLELEVKDDHVFKVLDLILRERNF